MLSVSIPANRRFTSFTRSGLTMEFRYMMDTLVWVTLPIWKVSSHSRVSLIFLRTKAVLVRIFSVKPSIGPLTTVCEFDSPTSRSSQPGSPIRSAASVPSTITITLPDISSWTNCLELRVMERSPAIRICLYRSSSFWSASSPFNRSITKRS
ncbi:hypothetical protein D3C75_812640 [compost metagenome]